MGTASLTAELENLVLIRRFVEKTAQNLQADQAAIDDIIQAVDEAACNIIVHGYAAKPGIIEIEVKRERDTLAFRVSAAALGKIQKFAEKFAGLRPPTTVGGW